jgi:hypothetical protein
VNLAILYSTVIGNDSQDFSWLNRPVLHLGNVSGLADGGWSLRLLSDRAGIERTLFDQFRPIRRWFYWSVVKAFIGFLVSAKGELVSWLSPVIGRVSG